MSYSIQTFECKIPCARYLIVKTVGGGGGAEGISIKLRITIPLDYVSVEAET